MASTEWRSGCCYVLQPIGTPLRPSVKSELSANVPKEGRVKNLKTPALPGLFLLQENHPISLFPALPQVSVWQGCQKQESQLLAQPDTRPPTGMTGLYSSLPKAASSGQIQVMGALLPPRKCPYCQDIERGFKFNV